MKNIAYTLYIGGSELARFKWKNGRTYTRRSSAMRRMKQIRAAHDLGVVTIWLVTSSL